MTKNYYAPMHTAEHILNRTMVNMFACKRSENCHIERKKSKCDFELETEPNEQQIREIEQKVNEIISQNLEITETLQTFNKACNKFNLSRINNTENSWRFSQVPISSLLFKF